MMKILDGAGYVELVYSGLQSLERHRKALNDLNVFPVPDGDTGTNMVMTLRYGYEAIKNQTGTLAEISAAFSSAAVFGARGNSGVIVSQFFKGMSEGFRGMDAADSRGFAEALQSGCRYAYAAVSKPVEGTILTVVKDASAAVASALPLESIDEAVDVLLAEARASLARTPELLPILKKASVVDSGGSGIVCFFEGVQKHLHQEPIDAPVAEAASEAENAPEAPIDLSLFNKSTVFSYGYCMEGMLQLKIDENEFDVEAFKAKLSEYGDSIVASREGDKIKLHVHGKKPGRILDLCQRYGEFLTFKMENMTVQNMQKEQERKKAEKFLTRKERTESPYAIVAVSPNPYMQRRFLEMGSDVVIFSEIAPSSQDFLDAFALTEAKRILVFPNSANSILASMQAGSLYRGARVTVLNSRSVSECYAALSVMDFEATLDGAVSSANDVLSNLHQFSVYHAVKDVRYGSKCIRKNDFFALSDNHLLCVCDTLEDTVLQALSDAAEKREYAVATLFYGKFISPEYMEGLVEKLETLGHELEIALVATEETIYDITVALE